VRDVSFRLAPLNREEVFAMMQEVKSYPLLTGFRGSKPVDLEQLATTVTKLSEILLEIEAIKEIEINPLLVCEVGAVAVDARVVLQ
jgi:acyl-CoA synthetase (NDP forming)